MSTAHYRGISLSEISREHLNPLEMEISDTLREVANDIDERVSIGGKYSTCIYFIFCVEVLWPSQPIRVMSSTVILPSHLFPGQV